MRQVFISYQNGDFDFAENLATKLNSSGFKPWQYSSHQRGGALWKHEIDQAIRSSCALIVVMSPEAKKSEYVTYEWAFALGVGINVIPVIRKETALHPRLGDLHHLDFTNYYARPWRDLISDLKRIIQNLGPNSHSTTNGASQQPQQNGHSSQKPLTLALQDTNNPGTIQKRMFSEADGDAFYQNRKYQEAEKVYRSLIEQGLASASAYKKMGDTLMQRGKYIDAVTYYRTAIDLGPDVIESYIDLFECHMHIPRYREANTVAEKMCKRFSNNITGLLNATIALLHLKDVGRADEFLQRAKKLEPANAHLPLYQRIVNEAGTINNDSFAFDALLRKLPLSYRP